MHIFQVRVRRFETDRSSNLKIIYQITLDIKIKWELECKRKTYLFLVIQQTSSGQQIND